MNDFSKPHRGVAYFGIWATETADDYGRRAAVAILTAAAELCLDEDMREDREVRDALAYLTAQGHDRRAAQFRAALDLPDPVQRVQAAFSAVRAIVDSLGRAEGRPASRF